MSSLVGRWTVIALTLATSVLPGTAFGQARRRGAQAMPRPTIQSLFPLGVHAGETADVTVRGTDLEGTTALWFDHPGLRAFHLKGTTFRVACAPGTPVGHHDVRALGTYGVSNPRTIVVGDRPEAREVEPNNAPTQATRLAINTVVNGEIAQADVDCFAFEGRRGQRVLLDLEAERVDSRLDATLRLLDPSGREIGENRDAEGSDPFLDATLPADGRYVVKVHDVIFHGSNDFPYRLTLTDGPHIDAVIPAVTRPGETTTLTLVGRNLGGEPSSDRAFDGRPLERTSIVLKVPDTSNADPAYPTRGFVLSSGATRTGFEYARTSPSGTSNSVFIASAVDPVVEEVEPNDGDEQVQKVTLPCDISGRFGTPGDLDVYRFRAKKGDVWWVVASAERIGSPADPVFFIQKVISKDQGKGKDKGTEKERVQDLVGGEDTPDRGGLSRFNTATVDAAIRWQVPEDGDYQVAINDLYATQRGDVRLAYRLSLHPERPDFQLFVLPEDENQPDALTLRAGGRAVAVVLAVRMDGFNGPIQVEATDLPEGVHCDPVVIPSGQSLGMAVFEAVAGARSTVGTARFVGRARFGDRKDDLRYVAGATSLGPDLTHDAIGGSIVWPVQPVPNQPRFPSGLARLTRGFVVRVIDDAPLTLTARAEATVLTQGSPLVLDLRVNRRAGFADAVAVSPFVLNSLPNQAQNPRLTAAFSIAKTADRGSYVLPLPKTTAPGTYSLVLLGSGNYPFSKDPKAKSKPNVLLSEPSNVITYIVRPSPATLTVKPASGSLRQGKTLEVAVTVARKDGSGDPVEIALSAPETLKLSANPIQVVPGKTGTLVVNASAETPLGPATGVVVRATVPVRGEPVHVDELVPLTIAK